MLTDEAGNVVSRYSYDAFGNEIESEGDTKHYRGYTGQQYDEGTGLIYMGARYYSPTLGRFISADSIVPDPENPQAFNRYSYVYNNPISNVDPTGHEPVTAALAVAAVFIGKAAAAVASFVVANQLLVIGIAITVAGYALDNPYLMTLGAILTGFAGGAIYGAGFCATGAAVAAATSPLSPLDPGIKQAIGWAWTAFMVGYSIHQNVQAAAKAQNASTETIKETAEAVVKEEPLDHALSIGTHYEGDGVGHAFTALEQPGASADTYGFWPGESVSFDSKGALTSVKGELRKNFVSDQSYFQQALAGEEGFAIARFSITKSQYNAAMKVISSYQGKTYNALMCNCTSFVADVAKAANVRLPSAGVIKRPAVLHRNLERLAK